MRTVRRPTLLSPRACKRLCCALLTAFLAIPFILSASSGSGGLDQGGCTVLEVPRYPGDPASEWQLVNVKTAMPIAHESSEVVVLLYALRRARNAIFCDDSVSVAFEGYNLIPGVSVLCA